MKKLYGVLVLILIFSAAGLGQLRIMPMNSTRTVPGYIDKAVLVVEPHGSYSEQSLYIDYSDHKQFSAGQNVEIIHQFHLPEGAVVNDLWLWIGDSVMKAIVIDRWRAQEIYDSIVVRQLDPALLVKNGNEYLLKVFPLQSGKFRKIKMNFIAPVKISNNNARAELPSAFLLDNNNSVKPLDILFRKRAGTVTEQYIEEEPGNEFTLLTDSMGYRYEWVHINDISQFEKLTLSYSINNESGIYFSDNKWKDGLNYFQLTLHPGQHFFEGKQVPRKLLFGLDINGLYDKNFDILIPRMKQLINSTLKPQDKFNLIVSGDGKRVKLSEEWLESSGAEVNNLLEQFAGSSLGRELRSPKILFADAAAELFMNFNGVEAAASIKRTWDIVEAKSVLEDADIAVSINHYQKTDLDFQSLLPSLADFFNKGGKFITYYNYERDEKREKIAQFYITGLKTDSKVTSGLLFPVPGGNISHLFKDTVYTGKNTYSFKWYEPGVQVELEDGEGNPVVISKKVGKGMIIVSGIYTPELSESGRRSIAMPLLGFDLHEEFSIGELLNSIKSEYIKEVFDEAVIVSNSDKYTSVEEGEAIVGNYLSSGYDNGKPMMHTINLLEKRGGAVIPSVFKDGKEYLGSGYLLKELSLKTGGKNFECNRNEWNDISEIFSTDLYPTVTEFNMEVKGDGGSTDGTEIREIDADGISNWGYKFFAGSTEADQMLTFEIKAAFGDDVKEDTLEYMLSTKIFSAEPVLRSVLGNEIIKELMKENRYDTALVVNKAIEYNLLCNYTAMLALEPNDTLKFIDDPFNEGGLLGLEDEIVPDSMDMAAAYPNPFNSQTKIVVRVGAESVVKVTIYNILGQQVNVLANNEEFTGSRIFTWDGRSGNGEYCSSGIYFTRVETVSKATSEKKIHTVKLMMMK